MSGAGSVRVLVVDDEPLVRTGIAAVLGSAPDLVVVAAVDGPGALAVLDGGGPPADVVLLDVRMPGVDGWAVLRRLRLLPDPPAVAMLTTFHADTHVTAALRAGADGYLLKDTDPDQLVQHVRALARGRRVLSSAVTAPVVDGFLRGRPDDGSGQRLARLTPRERDVLRLLVLGEGNADIARALGLSVPTVKDHVAALLTKLEVGNRVQAAVLAARAGWATGDGAAG